MEFEIPEGKSSAAVTAEGPGSGHRTFRQYVDNRGDRETDYR